MTMSITPRVDCDRCANEPALVMTLLRELSDEFEAPCRCYDGGTGAPVGREAWSLAADGSSAEFTRAVREAASIGRSRVFPSGFERFHLMVPLDEIEGLSRVAVLELTALARTPEDARRERKRLEKWAKHVHHRIVERIRGTAQRSEGLTEEQQLTVTLRGVLELGELLHGLQSSVTPAGYPTRVLQRVLATLPVETLIWIPTLQGKPAVVEGRAGWSPQEIDRLAQFLARSPGWDASGCLIVNCAEDTPLGRAWPAISNVLAVRVREKSPHGVLIALNKRGDRPKNPGTPRAVAPFRRLDAALLRPFAGLLGAQSRLGQHRDQLRDVMTGLVRALISVIDAKTPRSFGHTERVARTAVEIGRELGLSQDELSELYLGSLLHDIGNVGVHDAILTKAAPLDPAEAEEMHQHVTVGFRILADFHSIAGVLPLILYHHERFDGSGYPEGLSGEEIPLAARILAVADSYQAMLSSRPHRNAMTRADVETALNDGSGHQWDARVVDAFFRIRDRIDSIHLSGIGDSVCIALEGSLRHHQHEFATGTYG